MHVINGYGDGDGHCYRIEAVMHVIDVMARVDGSDGHCYRIEAVMHLIHVMVMVIE